MELPTQRASTEVIVRVVQKYHAFALEQEFIEAAFADFDTNQSGALEKPQLAMLLHSISPKTKPNDADVEFVLENADLDVTNQSQSTETSFYLRLRYGSAL